jgi:hypothetical protein
MHLEHEKAAGVLDTPEAAYESKRTPILEPQRIERKEFETLRARFARRGYVLQRVYRADDGRPTYHASRTSQTRVFSHPHDLGAFLAVVEGAFL